MNAPTKYLLFGLAACTTAGLAALATAPPRAAVQGTPAQDAPIPSTTDYVFDSKGFELAEFVFLDVSASILSPIVPQVGVPCRSIAIRAQFTRDMTLIGESGFHDMVPITSTRTIDVSCADLALTLGSPLPAGVTLPTSYSITLVPVPGKTWGTVRSFKDDILVLVNPVH